MIDATAKFTTVEAISRPQKTAEKRYRVTPAEALSLCGNSLAIRPVFTI
jgi:hypothetical protein